jgi:hypothetical protein
MNTVRLLVAALAAAVVLPATAQAAPTYTLAPHCAGLTFDTAGWPAGTNVQVSTKRPNYNYITRVNRNFTDTDHEKVSFGDTAGGNFYRIQVVGASVAPLILAGFQNPCTRRYYNQVPVAAPSDWFTSGGFTG